VKRGLSKSRILEMNAPEGGRVSSVGESARYFQAQHGMLCIPNVLVIYTYFEGQL